MPTVVKLNIESLTPGFLRRKIRDQAGEAAKIVERIQKKVTTQQT